MIAIIRYPNIDPVLVHLGPVAVHWYGVAYLAGFLIAYGLLGRLSRSGWLRIGRDKVSDLISWLVLGVLVGGRLGWWIFYSTHPLNVSQWETWYEPIALWHGGMSFHGGLIGVILAVIVWARRAKAPFWNVADALALAAPVGLLFGRLANFINGELYGRPTEVGWAMIFPTDPLGVPRHPSQLYEAMLEGVLLLACLWMIKRWARRDGVIASAFVILYGVFRIAVEFAREPDPQLGYLAWGWVTMGQVLSLALALVGLAMLWSRRRTAAVR